MKRLLPFFVALGACADNATGRDGGSDVRSDVAMPTFDAAADVAAKDGPLEEEAPDVWAVHPPPDDVEEVPCREIFVPNESPVSPEEIVCVPGRAERCTTRRVTPGTRVCDGYGQWGPCVAADTQVIRDNTTGMWRHGAPIVLPPRLIAPLSARRVTSRRPTLRWSLPEGMTRARVELCDDRACTRRIGQAEVTGSSWRPTEVLRPGVVFWHVLGLRDDSTVGWTSATWEFGVGYRDTPTDTIGTTLKDFNGDGFDDAVVGYHGRVGERPAVLLGSRAGGRLAPTVFWTRGTKYTVGDVNGDGYADLLTSVVNGTGVGWMSDLGFRASDGDARMFWGGPGCPFQRTRRILQPALNVSVAFAEAMAAGDFDGDGFDDVAAMFQRGLAIYSGGSEGLSREPSDIVLIEAAPLFFAPDSPAMRFVGDIDRDGYADLAAVVNSSSPDDTLVQVYYGNPEGRLGARVQSVASTRNGEFHHLVGADFSGDGYSDVVVSSYAGFHLFVGSPNGLVRRDTQGIPSSLVGGPGTPRTVSPPGDLDGDGLPDLIVDGHYVFRSLGEAGLSNGPALNVAYYIASPGDMNADGFDDLLVWTGSVFMFFRGGTFQIESPERAWNDIQHPIPVND